MACTSGHEERDALNAYLEGDALTDAEKTTLVELAEAILRDAAEGWPEPSETLDDEDDPFAEEETEPVVFTG